MKDRKQLIALICILMLVLCACKGEKASVDEGNVPDSKEGRAEFPDSIQKTYSDLFESDAVVYCPEEYRDGTGMSAESEEYFFYDEKEEAAEKIAGSRKLLTTETSEQDFIQYIYEDDSILFLARENNRLVFNTPWIGYMLNTIWMDEEFDNYNASLYLQEKDLSFMSRKEAWAEVKGLLSGIGVEASDDYTCYIMDHEVMQEQEKVIDVNGNEDASKKKGSWTEEDDCYYFLLSQTWNGMKVVSGQNRGEGTDEENIKVVYGKDGIRSLEIIGYCSLKEKEEDAVRSPETAVEKTEEHFENIISNAKVTVTDVSLCEKAVAADSADDSVEMILAWDCTVEIQEEDASIPVRTRHIYINAETLKEIVE